MSVNDFVIVDDDTLPIRNTHFLIRRDRSQIKTTTIGAQYIAEIMALGWHGVGVILEVIDGARAEGREFSAMDALAMLANNVLLSDRLRGRGRFGVSE